jgi:hypothetical protein
MARKSIPPNTIDEVLLQSRRRCAICFGLEFDTRIKPGQIAHLDQNNTNADVDNLVFLCLHHHDEYDSKTSQSKGMTVGEVRTHRKELYSYISSIKSEENLPWTDYPELKQVSESLDRELLSLEIYEYRIRTYRIVRQLLGMIVDEGNVEIEPLLKFANDTDEALFIFDKELSQYLQLIYRNGIKLHFSREKLSDQRLPIGEERNKVAEENAELLEWFTEQFEVSREYFYKHIALG